MNPVVPFLSLFTQRIFGKSVWCLIQLPWWREKAHDAWLTESTALLKETWNLILVPQFLQVSQCSAFKNVGNIAEHYGSTQVHILTNQTNQDPVPECTGRPQVVGELAQPHVTDHSGYPFISLPSNPGWHVDTNPTAFWQLRCAGSICSVSYRAFLESSMHVPPERRGLLLHSLMSTSQFLPWKPVPRHTTMRGTTRQTWGNWVTGWPVCMQAFQLLPWLR